MNKQNYELELAEQYINETDVNLFLTGRAGTGKTTFLKTLQKNSTKRHVVTAPTGVAAINAGGVTLHSLFQLPFAPFIPGSDHSSSVANFRFSREKKNVIKNLDLLVIDEVSMVRGDLLDSVDHVFRWIRRSQKPFGGVQLLLIGDLYQLPPVVKNNEWQLLANHYQSPYFFSSHALAKTELCLVELKTIYRQSDAGFITILNQVRDNDLDQQSLDRLNSRVIPDFAPSRKDECITLCTHNKKADSINLNRFSELEESPYQFPAAIEGEFPGHVYPAAAALELKKGVQVMFVKNDPSQEKQYFNGKIGLVTYISDEEIHVRCSGDKDDIIVKPVVWENIEYRLNEETLELEEKKIGSFTQYPLRYAWAITIHKSQGLTFDKAVIDAQAAFAHGQVYVALSRCRTLEGMVLSAPISPKGLSVDKAIVEFNEATGQESSDAAQGHLAAAKIRFQQQLIYECFDFHQLHNAVNRMTALLLGNQSVLQLAGGVDLEALKKEVATEIVNVGENFRRQLAGLFQDQVVPAEDPAIKERLEKASLYFSEKIKSLLAEKIEQLSVEADNKELRKKVRNSMRWLEEQVRVKGAAVSSVAKGFSAADYFRAVSEAVVEKKKTKKKTQAITYTEKDIAHPELFEQLRQWRSEKAATENVSHFQVLHQKTLVQIVVNLPVTTKALLKIKGIGAKLNERYGDELLAMVSAYRKKNNIEVVTLPEPIGLETVLANNDNKDMGVEVDTKQQSLEFFHQGLTVEEIAEKRGLLPATIENHLAYQVGQGVVDVTAVLDKERVELLLPKVKPLVSKEKLKEIKESIDVEVSYGELQLLLAHLKCTS